MQTHSAENNTTSLLRRR